MSTPQLFCPVCESELEYLTTMQMGAFEEGGYRETEVLDVGLCPACHRRRYRDRSNATYKPPSWEPVCPECGEPTLFRGSEAADGPHKGIFFFCPTHPTRQWMWRADDTWAAV